MTLQVRLNQICACLEAKRWAAKMTAAEAWGKCQNPAWRLWWWATERPEDRPAIVSLVCEQLRERTLSRCRDEDRGICEAALSAAEAWVLNPCEETRVVAHSAADAAGAVTAYAPYSAIYAAHTAYSAAYAVVSGAYPDDVSRAAYHAVCSAYATYDFAREKDLWCAAIQSRRPEPPWTEKETL